MRTTAIITASAEIAYACFSIAAASFTVFVHEVIGLYAAMSASKNNEHKYSIKLNGIIIFA